jgi:hypothetical protein
MKIVVYRVAEGSWRWAINDGHTKSFKGNIVVGLKWYTRKSDAKRVAERFEQRLFEAYSWADEGHTSDGCMLPVEVLD